MDLLVLGYGGAELFHNDGGGRFSEVSGRAGLVDPAFGVSAVWLDYNNDGYLDVYVGNYLSYDRRRDGVYDPAVGYPGPLTYDGQSNRLFRNNGDGTFTDVTKEVGLWRPDGRSMGVTAADLNNDGRLELLSANDAMADFYFEADGRGGYRERALEVGLAYGENGESVAHMGPAVGDVNRDGLLDVFVADLRDLSLFLQRPGGGFEFATSRAGLGVARGQHSGWSSMLADFDHDGWLDLMIVNGGAQQEIGQEGAVYRNTGRGRFEDASQGAGPYFQERHVGRGGAVLDFDNDGRMDVVISNLDGNAALLRNETASRRHWITVVPRLRFPTGERDALGARVLVEAAGIRSIADFVPTQGYLSGAEPVLNFGLGSSARAERVQIRWPDGAVDEYRDLAGDRVVRFVHPARAVRAAAGRR